MQTGAEVRDGRGGEGGEAGAIVGGDAEEEGDVGGGGVVVLEGEFGRDDDGAVLDDVARDIVAGDQGCGVCSFEAGDLLRCGAGEAVCCVEDCNAAAVEGLFNGEVAGVGCAVVAVETQIDTAAEVAVHHCALEQGDGFGAAQESAHAAGAGGAAADCDAVGVAAKVGDVGCDPLQGGDLVADAVVAFDVCAGDGQEAEGGEAVIDGHGYNVLAGGEVAAVRAWVGACATGEASAVDPEEDWTEVRAVGGGEGLGGCVWKVWRLDVQKEAIFTSAAALETLGTVRSGIDGLSLAGVDGGIFESVGRVGIRDAKEAKGFGVPIPQVCVASREHAELALGRGCGVLWLILERRLCADHRKWTLRVR